MEEEIKCLDLVGDDEALSLSDLVEHPPQKSEETCAVSGPVEFEFQTPGSVGLCAADEVFFKGQILPLRPSVSSRSSESIERVTFNSSRSSSRSSMSRSQSSSSSSETSKFSVSNGFYTHPSPNPRLRRAKAANAGRRSTGSPPAGWRLFRLGVVQAPEIEIHNLKARRTPVNDETGTQSFRETRSTKSKPGSTKSNTGSSEKCETKCRQEKNVGSWFGFGFGFGCKRSSGSVSIETISKKEKEDEASLKRGESVRQRRIFDWLEQLTVSKVIGT